MTSRVQAAKNQAEIVKGTAEGKTQEEIGEGLGLHRVTVSRNLARLRGGLVESEMSYIEEHRARQMVELAELKASLVSPRISDKDKVELALKIIDREMDLLGTRSPSKSVNLQLRGPQLDPLYLDIRKLLLDADEETRELALEAVSSIVQAHRLPITVDAMPLIKMKKELE